MNLLAINGSPRKTKNTSNAPMIVMTVQAVEGSLKGFNTSDGYMDREV